jgi:hypothetical protein
LANLIKVTLVDEGAGKRRWESGILSHHHRSARFCGLAARVVGTHWWDDAHVVPAGNDSYWPFARDLAYLKFND